MKNKTTLVFALAMIVSSSLYAQQFIPTKNIVNARDLGGYVAADGMKVKDAQTQQVDAVTGATFSSEAVIKNVQLALDYYQSHK